MKLSKLIAFSLLITLNALATEGNEPNRAPPALVQDYLDYCNETISDEESSEESILECVNTQLKDSDFDTFETYKDLLAYLKKEDE